MLKYTYLKVSDLKPCKDPEPTAVATSIPLINDVRLILLILPILQGERKVRKR
jgi:hypothetical protein